jgi:hypothetical protein
MVKLDETVIALFLIYVHGMIGSVFPFCRHSCAREANDPCSF